MSDIGLGYRVVLQPAEITSKTFELVTLLALMLMVFFYSDSSGFRTPVSDFEIFWTAFGITPQTGELWTPFDILIASVGVWVVWAGDRSDKSRDGLIVTLRVSISSAAGTIYSGMMWQIWTVQTHNFKCCGCEVDFTQPWGIPDFALFSFWFLAITLFYGCTGSYREMVKTVAGSS